MQLELHHSNFEHFEHPEHLKSGLPVLCSFEPILPLQNLQAFWNGTFDRTHVPGSMRTNMENPGIGLLQEKGVFHRGNCVPTDADHRCATKVAFSNDQFEGKPAVGKPGDQMVVRLQFMGQRKDHFSGGQP